ncbi:MAG: hypothetical protein ACK5UG_10155 [Synechococcaceae cyanobacterium]
MLSEAELQQLEATLLPALERHHLRLLAHALRTLQAIAAEPVEPEPGPFPGPAAIDRWARDQSTIGHDHSFVEAFVAQLGRAADQLGEIAGARSVAPLDLSLEDLCGWAVAMADRRIRASTANPPPG